MDDHTTTDVEAITTTAPDRSQASPPQNHSSSNAIDHESDALLARFRSNVRIARRHSTQLASGVVYPIPEGAGETSVTGALGHAKHVLRRSSTLRGFSHTSKAWAPMLAGISRAGASLKAFNDTSESAKETICETPYEEMVVRFQIRQIQRTPSGTVVRSEDKRGSTGSSRSPESEAPGGSNDKENAFDDLAEQSNGDELPDQLRMHQRLSSLQTSDHITSSHDGNPDRASLASTAPPLGEGHASFSVRPLNFAPQPRTSTEQDEPWRELLESIIDMFRIWLGKLIKPISPFSGFSQARYMAILLVATTYVAFFPLGFAFPDVQQFTYVDDAVGVFVALDVLLTLHTSYMKPDGTIVDSHRDIARRYLKTRFVLDALLTIPLVAHVDNDIGKKFGGTWIHLVLDVLSAERLAYFARSIRMIWLMRLNQSGSGNSVWAWLLYSRYSHLLRIAGIVMMLVAIAHYIACVWNVLLEEGGDLRDMTASWRDQYSASFYSALLLLQGEGVPTNNAAQNMFASLCVLAGSIVLAIIFGHVAILVSNFNANFTSYQRKMEEVFAMTAKLQLPPSLRERIHEYYEHLWHEYECLDGEIMQFSKELSHTLGLEVVLFKYMELVMHVPFWKDCTPDFQKQLMLRLDVRVYLPNDFIMREGEVDDEFYMVNRGYCELSRALHRFERVTNTRIGMRRTSGPGINTGRSQGRLTSRNNGGATGRRRYSGLTGVSLNDGHRQSAYELDPAQRRYYSSTGCRTSRVFEVMVTRGQAFGDLALLMNYQRAANVRAITHVEMCVLSRDNFQAVLTRYPDDRRRVVVDMLTSYMQSYEMTHSRCPLLELVRKVYSAEAIAEACAKAGSPPPLLPPVLTARQAAERVYTAINLETNDETLKFGIGANIREKLIDLRERRRQKRQNQRHPRSILGQDALTPSLKTGGDGIERQTSESTSDSTEQDVPSTIIDSSPQVPAPAKETQPSPQTQSALSWQERLHQIEEREVVILRALQDLQASFKLLQARQAASAASPTQVAPASDDVVIPSMTPPPKSVPGSGQILTGRKRSLPEKEIPTAEAAAVTRPRLLQRMGSLVRRSSGSTPDARAPQPEVKPSPTRYADQLFKAHTKAASFRVTPAHRRLRVRPPPQVVRASTFSTRSEKSPRLDTMDSSTAAVFNPLESSSTATVTSPDSAHVEQLLQRKRSIRRTHSQILQALTEGKVASQASSSIGSPQNPSTSLFRRVSPAVSENRESPTRYADALFRPRTIIAFDKLSTDADSQA
ncbi:hypothetical protein ON010_g4592 [Phytophthora cinnamomi]|nr:hypothetical protein ON010_g4592 [Phytophthora cinnamomi]